MGSPAVILPAPLPIGFEDDTVALLVSSEAAPNCAAVASRGVKIADDPAHN